VAPSEHDQLIIVPAAAVDKSRAAFDASTGVISITLANAGKEIVLYVIVMMPEDELTMDATFSLPESAVESSKLAPIASQVVELLHSMELGPRLLKVSVIAVFNAEDNVTPSETFARMAYT